MIALAGSCKVRVLDTAGDEVTFELNSAEEGLYVPKMLWKDMLDFSEDCVLLVLASEHYDSGEYIRDLDAYLKMN
jgi:dTDP-4-dehydrorhamnose 3,5-epimerase-like enzyme